jgi:acetoacetate decarboxylase
MTADEVRQSWCMPHSSPSFPRGPYRFVNREYAIFRYLTDPAIIRDLLPEPLEPADEPIVLYEWIRMPDSAGFGDYTESGVVLPCRLHGENVNFILQMYLDDLAPIAAGREIWGFPKEFANPSLKVHADTLTGELSYANTVVAIGTMEYKPIAMDIDTVARNLAKTQINLKIIPGATGEGLDVCQLVAYNLTDISVRGAWEGQARLHLVPHVHAPVADLPVRKMLGGHHYIADLTLPYGRIAHDYLK